MSLVFQYGSNTSVQRLNSLKRLNGAAKVIGPAYTTEKFEFAFTVHSEGNKCAVADIIPNGSKQIWGVVYEIPKNMIFRHLAKGNSLDKIEGEGGNYERKEIKVSLKNSTENNISVLTYVVRERKPELKTSLEYSSEIINGLKSHDIPKSYVEYVYNCIIENNSELKGKLPSLM